MEILNISALKQQIQAFVKARHWTHFQSPKNIAMALNCEAAELLEIFQWLTEEQSYMLKHDPAAKLHAGQELADIIVYAISLADGLEIDLAQAIADKLVLNAQKYPLEK
jgi:dCTP diphosphatase